MTVDFCRRLVGKTLTNVCHCTSIRFAVKSVIMDIFLKLTDSVFLNKSSPFISVHNVVLYSQNGDRIVTIDSVTSLHAMYTYYS